MSTPRPNFYTNIEHSIVSEHIRIPGNCGDKILHSCAIYFSKLKRAPLPNFHEICDIVSAEDKCECKYTERYTIMDDLSLLSTREFISWFMQIVFTLDYLNTNGNFSHNDILEGSSIRKMDTPVNIFYNNVYIETTHIAILHNMSYAYTDNMPPPLSESSAGIYENAANPERDICQLLQYGLSLNTDFSKICAYLLNFFSDVPSILRHRITTRHKLSDFISFAMNVYEISNVCKRYERKGPLDNSHIEIVPSSDYVYHNLELKLPILSLESLFTFILARLRIVNYTIECNEGDYDGDIDELEKRLHEIPPHIRYGLGMLYSRMELIGLIMRIVPVSIRTFSGTPYRLVEILHVLSLLSKPSILASYIDVAKRNISEEEYANITRIEIVRIKCK